MSKKNKIIQILLTMGILFAVIISCTWTTRVGKLQQEANTIGLDGVETVDVNLRMGAGELSIQGGTESLLDANFSYNVEDWKPLTDYAVSGIQATLWIEQPEVQNLGLSNYRYEWDLRFNQDVLFDFDIRMGAGKGRFDFSQLALSSLNLEVGAGDVEIDLTGDRNVDLDGDIQGGVGKLTILLPEDIGVKVYINGGLGSINTDALTQAADGYVNSSYGESSTSITLDIEGGVGDIELREYAQPSKGEITVDGIEVTSKQIIINGGSKLPDGACVRIELWAESALLTWWPINDCAYVKQGVWEFKVPIGSGETLKSGVQYLVHAYQLGRPDSVSTLPFDLDGPPMPEP
jgi:hypothetical protein